MDLRYFGTYFASVKHQFDDKWNGADTRLSTCDPHASKFVTNSDSPQEVEAGKEIIFTYDVRFEVPDWGIQKLLSLNLFSCFSGSSFLQGILVECLSMMI
jgi:hypothetical protein